MPNWCGQGRNLPKNYFSRRGCGSWLANGAPCISLEPHYRELPPITISEIAYVHFWSQRSTWESGLWSVWRMKCFIDARAGIPIIAIRQRMAQHAHQLVLLALEGHRERRQLMEGLHFAPGCPNERWLII